MKRYKPKNETYEKAFKVLLSVNHFLIIEFKEGHRWHKAALDHGVMHWFEEVDGFSHLPKSAKEIDGRKWFINDLSQVSDVVDLRRDDINNNCLSTKQRAEAFLALMQLVELRDAWNGEWKADWEDEKHTITTYKGVIIRDSSYYYQDVLSFKSEDLRDRFLEQFRDLIETAKELI